MSLRVEGTGECDLLGGGVGPLPGRRQGGRSTHHRQHSATIGKHRRLRRGFLVRQLCPGVEDGGLLWQCV